MKRKKPTRVKRLPDTSSAKHTRRKNKEFSKWLLIVVFAVMLALIVVIVIHAFTHDSYSSSLTTIAELWCGVLTVCIGFYFWKAKTENCKKYAQEFFRGIMRELCEKYSPEQAASLIEALSNYTRAITDGK